MSEETVSQEETLTQELTVDEVQPIANEETIESEVNSEPIEEVSELDQLIAKNIKILDCTNSVRNLPGVILL